MSDQVVTSTHETISFISGRFTLGFSQDLLAGRPGRLRSRKRKSTGLIWKCSLPGSLSRWISSRPDSEAVELMERAILNSAV